MGKKRRAEETQAKTKAKVSKKDTKKKVKKEEVDSDSDEDTRLNKSDIAEANLPPQDVLYKLVDRIESLLPKDDHVKYDSRARKLDWNKVAFDDLSGQDCQRIWGHIQERIRRFRIMAELIPDARVWISQPWTNFYKSKDHNRHPDMPKKPLSMYMLFYSEMREEILKTNPSMSMPEVAKACSEKYQKLSEKKKQKYKMRCDEMRKEYEERMEKFYRDHPDLRPVKAEKVKRPPMANTQMHHHQQHQPHHITNPAPPVPIQPQYVPIPQQHQVVATIQSPVGGLNMPIQMEMPHQSYQPQQQQVHQQQQHHQVMAVKSESDKIGNPYPNAPERPPKPFDLYFKSVVDERVNDPTFDRQSTAERCRSEWKGMKPKKKAKWIKRAVDLYKEYEDKVAAFQVQHPSYIPPDKKGFLTQEDQKILDKQMGRPEKPPSSAYSLFSKEMLNNPEIKKYPSKERMAHISERWKSVSQEQKERYQAQVNESMAIYRSQYDTWFMQLSAEERAAESDRMNTSKAKGKGKAQPATAKAKANALQAQQAQQQQQQPVTFTMTQTGSVMNMPQIIVQPQAAVASSRDVNQLRQDILTREPVEPARSPKQLYVAEWLAKHKKKKPADAKEAWKNLAKNEKKKWAEKLEPQRQQYIEDYTVFVRGLDKEELELYTELKSKRDEEEEARRQNESSDSEDSDSSDSDSDSESDSESDQ